MYSISVTSGLIPDTVVSNLFNIQSARAWNWAP